MSSDLGHQFLTTTDLLAGWAVFESTVGSLLITYSSKGITAVTPVVDSEGLQHLHRMRVSRYPGKRIRLVDPATVIRDRTGRPDLVESLPLDLHGLTEFQQAVLHKTAEIPPGEVRPYGWVAKEIGSPRAARAVGSALNKNPVPILIPCHRVNKSDGAIGHYAFGIRMKRRLLKAEGVDLHILDKLSKRGVQLIGVTTTQTFCFPTCQHARRAAEQHRVELRSSSVARKSRYRPCRICRPTEAGTTRNGK